MLFFHATVRLRDGPHELGKLVAGDGNTTLRLVARHPDERCDDANDANDAIDANDARTIMYAKGEGKEKTVWPNSPGF